MIKSTTETVIRRLAAAFHRKDSWPDDARAEFARGIADLDDNHAIAAVDHIIKTKDFRPTIHEFRAETVRISRNAAPTTTVQPVRDADRSATAFFAPRLKEILRGIGNGPQGGTAARCDALVDEWRAHQRER